MKEMTSQQQKVCSYDVTISSHTARVRDVTILSIVTTLNKAICFCFRRFLSVLVAFNRLRSLSIVHDRFQLLSIAIYRCLLTIFSPKSSIHILYIRLILCFFIIENVQNCFRNFHFREFAGGPRKSGVQRANCKVNLHIDNVNTFLGFGHKIFAKMVVYFAQ